MTQIRKVKDVPEELGTTELVLRLAEEGDELGVGRVIEEMPTPVDDIMVSARTPIEMAKAQDALISWVHKKVTYLGECLKLAEENLAAAHEAKVKTSSWKREVRLARNRITYYEKVVKALEAGYCIVPDFPLNIIAVRTNRETPTDAGAEHRYRSGVQQEKPACLPSGDGEYVNPTPGAYQGSVPVTRKNQDGSKREETETRFYTNECFEEIDFPLRIVRPTVLESYSKAAKAKIFDSIGVLPNNRRNVDPMIVGTIERREGARTFSVSFLVHWWIPTQSI